MALAIPSPTATLTSQEWTQFFMALGQPTHDLFWYPGLKLLADQYSITIPSPAEPISDGGRVSVAWYPALQRLAAAL